MRKRIGVLPVCAVLAVMFVIFFWQNGKVNANLADVKAQIAQSSAEKTRLESEQSKLNDDLEESGTDAFIERQARALYGFMKPDEIRLVINSPETLYGTDE